MKNKINCIWGRAWVLFSLLIVCLYISACAKEYSYERTDPIVADPPPVIYDSTTDVDSLDNQSVLIPGCASCSQQNETADSSWIFSVGNVMLCGPVTGAVISKERNALTFFGPSGCSSDSGMIITAYFGSEPLTKDRSYLAADRASLVYYDNISLINVFESFEKNQFILKVDSYIHQTGVLKGTFNGLAIFRNGDTGVLKNSSFNIRVKQ